MIKKHSGQVVTLNENMRGGEGEVRIEALLSPEELYEKGRLYSRVVLKPGCSIGYHIHENEMESYTIISGTGDYNDDGDEIKVCAGDVTLTQSGQSHGIKNNGGEDLVLIALILFK